MKYVSNNNKSNTNNKIKPKNYIFIVIIIIVGVILVQMLPDLIAGISYMIKTKNIFPLLFYLLKIIVALLIFSLFFLSPYLISKLASKKAKKDSLDKIDFGNYKDYYREIINSYHPLLLSYIDDFELSKKDVYAALLDLKLNGYIKIEKDKIEIINDNYTTLPNSLVYLLDNINKGIILSKLSDIVSIEALNKELIIKRTKEIFIQIILFFISLIVLSTLIPIGFNFIFSINFGNSQILFLIFIILISIFSIFMIFGNLFALVYIIKTVRIQYKRTDKGNEINKKLEGLKNFLKDFSNLDKKSIDELNLWNDYLIYSVLFNQNKTLIDEFNDNFKNIV